MGVGVARMQHRSTKSADTLYIRYHFADACVLVLARLASQGGECERRLWGNLRLRTWRGTNDKQQRKSHGSLDAEPDDGR